LLAAFVSMRDGEVGHWLGRIGVSGKQGHENVSEALEQGDCCGIRAQRKGSS